MTDKMNEGDQHEFPVAAGFPPAPKSRFVRLCEDLQELAAVVADKGLFLSQSKTARLLGVSTSRVGQFVDEGRLDVVIVDGTRYVTGASLKAFAKIERKNGRPIKAEADMARAICVGLGGVPGGVARERR